jgi:thiol:disulfide interchange protein DsbD
VSDLGDSKARRSYMRRFIAMALAFGLSGMAHAEPLKPNPKNSALKEIKAAADLTWGGDLASALEQAAKEKKLVFIDFTGETCVNCKINEKTVFIKPEVKEQFAKYIRVQMYADIVPAEFYKKDPGEETRELDAEQNLKFQKASFGTEQLPLYAIVKPAEGGKFEKVATYDEGKISKVDAFVTFLKKPLEGGK